jgi:hemoglobin
MDGASDWDRLGGDAVMVPLLRDFYERRIPQSPIAHLFPPDREETLRKQLAFQRMYWGGRDDYTPWRGHPRMRARHLPFPIDAAAARAWLDCMAAAVADSAMPEPVRGPYLAALERIATAMINREPEAPQPG